jgi:hypothetical protein
MIAGNDVDHAEHEIEQGAEDFPEDAARWTGEAVGSYLCHPFYSIPILRVLYKA